MFSWKPICIHIYVYVCVRCPVEHPSLWVCYAGVCLHTWLCPCMYAVQLKKQHLCECVMPGCVYTHDCVHVCMLFSWNNNISVGVSPYVCVYMSVIAQYIFQTSVTCKVTKVVYGKRSIRLSLLLVRYATTIQSVFCHAMLTDTIKNLWTNTTFKCFMLLWPENEIRLTECLMFSFIPTETGRMLNVQFYTYWNCQNA